VRDLQFASTVTTLVSEYAVSRKGLNAMRPEEKRYYVYIMASLSLTLYTGVTGDLYHRALQHKAGEIEGSTKKYHINRLVYYEPFKYVNNAIAREKQVKAWTRAKRLALIKTMNPAWQDLAEGWGEPIKLQIPHFVRDDKIKENDDGKTMEPENAGALEPAALKSKAVSA
jgi:putative endonuclease